MISYCNYIPNINGSGRLVEGSPRPVLTIDDDIVMEQLELEEAEQSGNA